MRTFTFTEEDLALLGDAMGVEPEDVDRDTLRGFAAECLGAGTPLDASNVMARVLNPAARRAGVPWAGFHSLRHTCATRLFEGGLNAKQVQAWLGHHKASFTLDTYVHLLSDELPESPFGEDPDEAGVAVTTGADERASFPRWAASPSQR